MADQSKQIKVSLDGLFDTKEIIKVVLQKLSSQALIYSIAIIILLLGSHYLFGKEAMYITIAIMAIFLLTLIAYLFFEQKQKLQNEDPKTISKLLTNRMSDIQKTSSALDVKVWTASAARSSSASRDIAITSSDKKNEFKISDRITIYFSSSQDGYLTLLNVGTSGKLTILFPNGLHDDNRIRANEIYSIPSAEDGFEYKLMGPAGKEKLKAIVTLEPLKLVESQFDKEGTLFKSSSSTAAARDIAIIRKKVDEIPANKWAEGSWEFKVE